MLLLSLLPWKPRSGTKDRGVGGEVGGWGSNIKKVPFVSQVGGVLSFFFRLFVCFCLFCLFVLFVCLFLFILKEDIFFFLFFVSLDKSFHNKHEEALQQFTSRMRKDICVDDVKLVGYVKETYSALGEKFLRKLLTYCKSVGIIVGKHADGRQRRTGTVFRVGSHFVLTNLHMVEEIAGQ